MGLEKVVDEGKRWKGIKKQKRGRETVLEKGIGKMRGGTAGIYNLIREPRNRFRLPMESIPGLLKHLQTRAQESEIT